MNLHRCLRSAVFVCALTAAALGAAGCTENKPTPALQGQVHLTLIHTADVHSRIYPYNLQLGQIDSGLGLGASGAIVNVGGAPRVSHIVGRERARADRVLHLDGGDCFQGAPIFNFFSGEAEIRSEAAMGTDLMVVANHEFDRGAMNLGKQLQMWANFPVLAANYLFEDPSQPGASPLGSIVLPYTVFDLKGLRVGAIGMGNLSSLSSIFDRPNRLGVTPLNTTEVAQFYVDLLRPQVDLVVLVTHLGLEYDEEMIETTEGIDVVLGGHNHIVLQPPKRVQDCSKHTEVAPDGTLRSFIAIDGPGSGEASIGCTTDADCSNNGYCQTAGGSSKIPGLCKIKRYCKPRDVILAHSGAFAKFVGRLDLVVSNDKEDLPVDYDPVNNFEVVSHEYQLFPVTENTPEDPVLKQLLEPYEQALDAMTNLNLVVGYALDGSKRNSTSGGDSALGNLIATAMWLRLGIQTDFSLTNTTGIRADLVPGPVTVEQMYNIFPFDNSITKMSLSGVEVQDLFDFVARRSSGRGCVSQAQIAGARVVIDCQKMGVGQTDPGVATNIYIGAFSPPACSSDADCAAGSNPLGVAQVCVEKNGHKRCSCQSDAQCPDKTHGQCDIEAGVCWQPIQKIANYELATSNYLAGGGSGFVVLKRNTTQNDTKVQQRDALIDFIRAGSPCGADQEGKLKGCTSDNDCKAGALFLDGKTTLGEGFICACPELTVEGPYCSNDPAKKCSEGKGSCVLAKCRDDMAAIQHKTCDAAPTQASKETCETALGPCTVAGEQCKYLTCVDRRLGNYSDGRLKMVGQ